MHRHGLEAGAGTCPSRAARSARAEEHVGLQVDQLVLHGLVELGLLGGVAGAAGLVDQRVDLRVLHPLHRRPRCRPPTSDTG